MLYTFHRVFQYSAVLLIGQRGAFSGGSGNDNRFDSARDLPVDQAAERSVIDLSSCLHRGDQCGSYTAENRTFFHKTLLLFFVWNPTAQKSNRTGQRRAVAKEIQKQERKETVV